MSETVKKTATPTVIDANYILRWFLNDVPAQAAVANRLLTTAPVESVVVDRVTVAEITYVLRGRKYDRVQICTLLEELFYYPCMRPLETADVAALELYAATKLDYEDCTIIALARQHGYTIASFDKKLMTTAADLNYSS